MHAASSMRCENRLLRPGLPNRKSAPPVQTQRSIRLPDLPALTCTGCGACGQSCPQKAISLLPDSEGFLIPVIDASRCVKCGLCEKICPVLAITSEAPPDGTFSLRESFACIARDEKIRAESSSGGVFTVLAEKVIADGGVVFGAEFAGDFSARQGWTENAEGIARFRGSKYVQSRTEDTFAVCKTFLESGRRVLYSGTPCQIAGLKAFLRKPYENLLTVDLICHGVPSPALWLKYRQECEKKSASQTVKATFRQKTDGWDQITLSLTFANGRVYGPPNKQNRYIQLFMQDNALRESCYRCAFRGDRHPADLTLADFWGVGQIHPDFSDNKGTSLVIVQSEKGHALLASCADSLRCNETDLRLALRSNPAYARSFPRTKKRNRFYQHFEARDIEELYRRFGKAPLPLRLCEALGNIARTILGNKAVQCLKSRLGLG